MIEPVIIGDATLFNMDCMEFLRAQPAKSFDLAIVDPPYGISIGKNKSGMGRAEFTAMYGISELELLDEVKRLLGVV